MRIIKNIQFLIYVILAVFLYFPNAESGILDESSRFIYPEYSKKISMDFKDANLNDVLKVFSQQSGLNFVASQEIANLKVALYLNEVPVEEALEKILQINNLTYEIQPGSDVFVVKPVTKPGKIFQTRVYHLKYATVSSSKLNKTIAIDSTSTSTSTSTAPTTTQESSGIKAAIQALLTESGHIVEDPRTNSLIITDVPSQFPLIEQTITRLDVPIPEILIEVEMLDISKNTADKMGIKYGDTLLSFTGAQRRHLYPFDQNMILEKQRFSFDSSSGSSSSSSSSGGGSSNANKEFVVGTLDASGATMLLQFLKTQSDTKSLARPRILTLNNETAQIKISTNEAIGVQTQTGAAQGIATQSVQAERVETGVFLTVTPQANLTTDEITLALAPKVIQARTGATFQGQTFRDPEERGTQSILRVNSGDTVIMGGLVRAENSDTVTKLPVLGDIPLVGSAFRHKDKSTVDRELIIFITPHIVGDKTFTDSTASNINNQLIREQDLPQERLKEIEKSLSVLEKKNYN